MIEHLSCITLNYYVNPRRLCGMEQDVSMNKDDDSIEDSGNKKRVRFADEVPSSPTSLERIKEFPALGCATNQAALLEDAKQSAQCTVADIAMFMGLDSSQRRMLWWSDRDFQRTCDNAMTIANFYAAKRRPYISSFIELHTNLQQVGSTTAPDCELTSRATVLAKTSARGLEQFIFPITYQARTRVVKAVLGAQADFPSQVDPGVRQRMLSAKSLHMSQHSRKFARLYGEGDAAIAENIYREELDEIEQSRSRFSTSSTISQ